MEYRLNLPLFARFPGLILSVTNHGTKYQSLGTISLIFIALTLSRSSDNLIVI